MTGATLFSGIAAPETAMPWVSWKWCAEIEPFPSAVIAHRHPNSPNLGDVTDASFIERAKRYGPVDLIVFGSPCQSFSVAGKRLGLDDPRGNLALIALGIIAELRPKWFLFENVPGLLSSESGRDFGAFVGTVGQLGYGWAYRVLDAQYFGVPQRRRRIFLVGHSGDWRAPAAVLFEQESLRRDSAPSREAGEGIARSLRARSNDSHREDSSTYVSMCLNAKGGAGRMDGESETFIPFHGAQITSATNQTDCKPGDPSPTLNGDPRLMVAFSCKDSGADAGQISPTLRSMSHDMSHANGGGQVAIAFDNRQGASGDISATCRSQSHGAHPMAAVDAAVRRLTPREWERLMGLADDYTLVPYRGKPAADGPRYKAIGNSIAIPPLRWIGERIANVDRSNPQPTAAALGTVTTFAEGSSHAERK